MHGSPGRTHLPAIVDSFLSARLRAAHIDELRRARVLVGGSLLMQTMLGAITIYSFREGLPSAWTTLLAVAVWAALLPLLRLGQALLVDLRRRVVAAARSLGLAGTRLLPGSTSPRCATLPT